VQCLRDQLGFIETASDVDRLAATVEDSGGVWFAAFSGLFALYWRSDARGAVLGLSPIQHRGPPGAATLEAICHQSCDVVGRRKPTPASR
jgi:glycerol kinase